MAKVQRTVVADGSCYEIACAVTADGTSPAEMALAELADNVWPDPEAEELPDEYQTSMRKRLMAALERLAETGELPRSMYNRLNDGIWEFKFATLRMSFFDTDGEGGWVPKLGTPSVITGPHWLLPDDFDEFIRLGHTFGKSSQRTNPADLQRCAEVREEDVAYDKAD